MKKRIIFAYPEMMLGGSTTSLLSLLNVIDYNRYDVDLILYKTRGDFLKAIPEPVNLLHQASKYSGNSLLSGIRKAAASFLNGYLLKALFYELKFNKKVGFNCQILAYAQTAISKKLKHEYDVAIGYLELWANAYVLNNVKAKKKITWIHTDYENASYIAEIDCAHLSNSNAIVCVSDSCLRIINKKFPSLIDKTTVIENILSKKYIMSRAEQEVSDIENYEGLKFLTVCRLSSYTKGIDRAVLAMKRLCDDGYDFKWYLIGEGGDRQQIENMVVEFGLENKFILLGKKVNPYPYYTKCDVYVMPSRFEGKPVAVTEAQLLGLPVIATQYSSAEEQVRNNIDGIIVDNDDMGIYYGIKKILNEPDLLEKYKTNLKDRQFSNEYAVDNFYALIE